MILLDDAQSTAAEPSSRLYGDVLHYWRISPSGNSNQDKTATQACLEEISSALAQGQFVVAAFAYELGKSIHGLSQKSDNPPSFHPLIEAWSFSGYQKLSKEAVDQLLIEKLALLNDSERIAGVLDIQASLNEEQFFSDIAKIQDHAIVRFTGMICNYTSQSDLDRITMTMQMATLTIMIRDAMT